MPRRAGTVRADLTTTLSAGRRHRRDRSLDPIPGRRSAPTTRSSANSSSCRFCAPSRRSAGSGSASPTAVSSARTNVATASSRWWRSAPPGPGRRTAIATRHLPSPSPATSCLRGAAVTAMPPMFRWVRHGIAPPRIARSLSGASQTSCRTASSRRSSSRKRIELYGQLPGRGHGGRQPCRPRRRPARPDSGRPAASRLSSSTAQAWCSLTSDQPADRDAWPRSDRLPCPSTCLALAPWSGGVGPRERRIPHARRRPADRPDLCVVLRACLSRNGGC